jgi:serine protease Do
MLRIIPARSIDSGKPMRLRPARRLSVFTAAGLACALLASGLQAADPVVLEEQQRRVAVVEDVSPTVVAIFAPGGAGGGSGVLITPDGYALTNFHVVASAQGFMQCGLNDGKIYDAVIVGIDPTGDVAMIKLLGRDDFPHAKLGDSDQLKVGDWAYAMGNPFLLATDFQPTVTYGIVSGVHRYQYPAGTFLEYTDCIQVDASINPGNSGGPLFNDVGELVGINGRGSFEKRGRVNSGAGYAISINQIKHFMDHLRSGRIVDHGTLGALVETEHDGTVVIGNILEQSEAYRRGLRIDDEVVSFAGRPIRSVNQFKNILGIYPKGWKLPLVYRRNQQKHEIHARLRGLHSESELAPRRRGPRQPIPGQPRPGRPDPEQPRPGRPGPDQPDDDKAPDGQPPRGRRPANPHQHAGPIPEEYKDMFVPKAGYSNYYFNEVEQQRALRGMKDWGDFAETAGRWSFAGTTADGKPFEFTLTRSGLGLELGNDVYLQQLDSGNFDDEPPGTGGLLTAMYHLRLFLTDRESGFDNVYYLGSEPLDGRGDKVDVLICEFAGVQSRWYFDREDGTLRGFDTQLEDDVDECEIRVAEFREFDGRRLPSRFVVRTAEKKFAEFEIEKAKLAGKE